ncbi:SMC family ATPase [candidate division KSB1 bacterium]|nr:SMC family ATPase [candidate division KSB1 bacterium]
MNAFNLSKIGDIAEDFIRRDKRFGYNLYRMEEESDHILFKAENLFSSLYCQITDNIELIKSWIGLQRELYLKEKNKINQYLIYVIPEKVVRENDLFEELSLAESNEYFFRKVFIELPDKYNKKIIEKSLANRIPVWISDKNKVLREYIPLIEDTISDRDLRSLLISKKAPAIVKEIEKSEKYSWLFSEDFKNKLQKQKKLVSPIKEELSVEISRIKSLELKNFRCFKSIKLDLDSDVVVIYGKNGRGKTSIVDAVEFSIFNKINRLEYDPDMEPKTKKKYSALINCESMEDEALIDITGISKNDIFKIETKIQKNKCILFLNNKQVKNEDIITFLTDNKELIKKKEYLDILLHTHFLGQHSIRHFIYGVNTSDENEIRKNRYDLISEMFGFGKIEALKRRLTRVYSEIKHIKINLLDDLIKEYKSNIRSISHKYGPRTRSEIEKKGHKIDQEYGIIAYKKLIDKLKNEIRIKLDESITDCQLPIDNYMISCDLLMKILNNELEKKKTHEGAINKLNQLYIKISSILSSLNINIEADNFLYYIENVQSSIKNEIRTIEHNKYKIEVLNGKMKELNENNRILNDFKTRFNEFKDLYSKEKDLREKIEIKRKENEALLKKKELLEEKLIEFKKSKIDLSRKINDLVANIENFLYIKKRLKEIEVKKILLSKNSKIISEIDFYLDRHENEIKGLIQSEDIDYNDIDVIKNIINKTDYFNVMDKFVCPCCGNSYSDKNELNENIIKQITDGKYREELKDFIFNINKKYKKLAIEEEKNIIQRKKEEREKLEKENSDMKNDIIEFEELLNKVCKKKSITEEEIKTLLDKSNSQLLELKNEIKKYDVESIRNETELIVDKIHYLNYEYYKNKHKETRDTISNIIEEIIKVIPEDKILNIDNIDNEINQIETDLKEYKDELEELEEQLKYKVILQQRIDEIEKDLVEMESLIQRYNLSDKYSIKDGIDPLKIDVYDQEKYYKLISKIKDLNNLFGLIRTKEESENIRNRIEKYSYEKKRWEICYNNLRKLNKELSSVSYSAFKKSLVQYSPLINEIYKKFIRHEYFNEVQLKPIMSKDQRKRSLYILLKNYFGEIEYTPSSYLSEAQLNILALSIFLTRVIYQNISILQTILIDDPVQQMDEMNTLSFVDIIIGLSRARKQIIITTCNFDFFDLFRQKLSEIASEDTKNFKAINLEDVL